MSRTLRKFIDWVELPYTIYTILLMNGHQKEKAKSSLEKMSEYAEWRANSNCHKIIKKILYV